MCVCRYKICYKQDIKRSKDILKKCDIITGVEQSQKDMLARPQHENGNLYQIKQYG